MRFLGRVLASIKYHRKYAIWIGSISFIYSITMISLLLMMRNEQDILSFIQARVLELSGHAARDNRIMMAVTKTRTLQAIHYQTAALYLTLITFTIISIIAFLYLKNRRFDFKAYQLMGKPIATISSQFAVESLVVAVGAWLIAVLLLSLFETSYFDFLRHLDDVFYTQNLPKQLAELKTTAVSSDKWQILNQLFTKRLTNFNGYMLIFNTKTGLSSSIFTDWRDLAYSLGFLSLTISIPNYLFALISNFSIRKQLLS